EVRLFRHRHPDRPVIPVLVEGSYPDNVPPALRFEITADGTVTDRPVTILGPDLREMGDGRQLGLAKVVAGLTGVAPDDIFRRAERARRRSARVRNGIIAVLALLVVAAGTSAYFFREELKRNEKLLEATLKTATDIVITAVAQAEKYSVPRRATLEMLLRAEALFDHMARLGRPTPELQRQKAWMLIQFARNYEILGDTTKQRARADEAQRILAALARARQDDPRARHALAAAHIERGDVLRAQGKLADALAAYTAARAILQRLATSDPGNAGWQLDLAVSNERIGDMLARERRTKEAIAAFERALEGYRELLRRNPDDMPSQVYSVVPLWRIGSLKGKDGKPELEAALAILKPLAAAQRLDAMRIGWISQVEAQIAAIERKN
ncbi:MAG: hypothetical protein R3D31_16780, partial [Hyphomicrobiaceae bacterium]